MHNDQEMPDGKEWIDKCQICKCQKGVLSCSPAPCECSSHPTAVIASGQRLSPQCCPQCDPNYDCRHQELHHIVFHSGEQWVYQCQTCECLVRDLIIFLVYFSIFYFFIHHFVNVLVRRSRLLGVRMSSNR